MTDRPPPNAPPPLVAPIRTRVAKAVWGDNRFRGYSMSADIAGNDGFWSLVSLAVGGRRLSPDEQKVLEDLCACNLAADPRIWPLKTCRLIASYGSFMAAIAAAEVWLDEGLLGPAPPGATAAALLELEREIGDAPDDERIADFVRHRLARGERLLGFGVPFRKSDERWALVVRCLERRGRLGERHARFALSLARAVVEAGGPPPNIALGIAAACLDLGFWPPQITALTSVFLHVTFLANAAEGSAEPAAVLRSLPLEWVEYRGAPSRKSPRAG